MQANVHKRCTHHYAHGQTWNVAWAMSHQFSFETKSVPPQPTLLTLSWAETKHTDKHMHTITHSLTCQQRELSNTNHLRDRSTHCEPTIKLTQLTSSNLTSHVPLLQRSCSQWQPNLAICLWKDTCCLVFKRSLFTMALSIKSFLEFGRSDPLNNLLGYIFGAE